MSEQNKSIAVFAGKKAIIKITNWTQIDHWLTLSLSALVETWLVTCASHTLPTKTKLDHYFKDWELDALGPLNLSQCL